MPDPASWQSELPYLMAALAFGYLIGSIPFGLVLTRIAGLGDVRAIGSGNIGATNVLRTGNRWLAAATLLCDILKGALPVFLAAYHSLDAALAAGLGAFFGHCLPVWLQFKGGKGVATYLGVLIGLAFKGALVFAAVWLTVAALTRYSSLAALLAALSVPLALYLMGEPRIAALFVLLSALIFLFHRPNIARLIRGEESRIGGRG